MTSSKFSPSSQTHSQPMKPVTSLISDQLTKSEIASLQHSKKSISDFVQKELRTRLKGRNCEHMLAKP